MQTINLDLSVKSIVPLVHAKQADVGRKFKAIITDGGAAYPVPAGAAVSIWYSGASGEGNYTEVGANSAVSVSGNEIVVELITQMVANYGVGTLCIVIHTADGKQLGTWNIPYMVEPLPGMGSAGSQDYFTAFSKAVQNLPYPDSTLSAAGKAADAAVVGAALAGKAPAGHGLGQVGGELVDVTDFSQLDGLVRNGWYFIRFPQPFYIDGVFTQFFALEVCGETGEHIHQTIHVIGSNYKLHRNCDMGVWGTVEWENPPMVPGVEYRTVERYNGKVVYAKAFNTGELTNGGSFDFVNENVTTVRAAAVCQGHLLPYYGGGDLVGGTWSIWYDITGKQFMGFMGSGMSANNYTVQAWYTKD